ncbi:hypothetical protein A2716_00825 [candidate division WWE3 bacterium RIFCSPHIGHO2_01_FULL_40_23]|uniref:Antitoxin n=1 Tax=candidate division WWE3 bacterium RIFCSPLOWO2_01_FULL_41_18 TaxID=1802625 RepID=A0A1F4VEE2_UNCKA|nr:MAG: hypothetical protein A2716_00825 [candidate division WWE3 bacterium RIFCSPHIGHO2_01_FULL_40_23]OGC55534.1 MAG: hypothetical protein A3A78_01095 [candidate division WWE3 bacterium RIFCSPLOWO2_01_FULL_41_18]
MTQEQIIKKERFTSIQEAQAGLTNILKKAQEGEFFYRVLRNNEPIGVLLPNNLWEDLIEDLEALSSPNYLKSIKEARKSKKFYTLEEVKKQLNLK